MLITITYLDVIMLIAFGWVLGVTTMNIKNYLDKRTRGDI